MTQPTDFKFPYDEEGIHDIALKVHISANRLIDDTAMDNEADPDNPVPTITYEEAVATIYVAIQQMQATITNTFTGIGLGLTDKTGEEL